LLPGRNLRFDVTIQHSSLVIIRRVFLGLFVSGLSCGHDNKFKRPHLLQGCNDLGERFRKVTIFNGEFCIDSLCGQLMECRSLLPSRSDKERKVPWTIFANTLRGKSRGMSFREKWALPSVHNINLKLFSSLLHSSDFLVRNYFAKVVVGHVTL
jgi:hypothetical protein